MNKKESLLKRIEKSAKLFRKWSKDRQQAALKEANVPADYILRVKNTK